MSESVSDIHTVMENRAGERPVDWAAIPPSAHLIYFYETDQRLVASIADFVQTGIHRHEAAIVVATKAHGEQLDQILLERGLDLKSLRCTGLYRYLDAAECLATFMVDGRPDRTRFDVAIRGIVDQAKSLGKGLRIYGEMVAIVWDEGNPQAAIAIEEFWNALQKDTPFALLCGYPVRTLDDGDPAHLAGVCGAHSTVIPAEGSAAIIERLDPACAIVALQRKAAKLEVEIERRRRVETELLDNRAELNDFLENAADGLHRIAGDGTIVWANQTELDMLGYSRDEYVGQNIVDFHADREVARAILASLNRNEPIRNVEARLRHKNGTWRTVLISSARNWRKRHSNSIPCIIRDISNSRRLQQAEWFLAALVESAHDAIIGKTLNGIITSWNPAAEKLFGYTAAEAIGNPITMLIPEGQQEEERQILARLRRGERIENYETRRLRKDGTIVEVSLTVSPIKNERNEIVGASKIARDITDRKQSQAALNSYRDSLERQVEDLKRLHEISLRLTKTVEMDRVFDEVLRAALDAQRTDLGLLSLYDPDRNSLVIKASRGFNPAFLDLAGSLSPSVGACGVCFTERRRVTVEDAQRDAIFAGQRELPEKGGFRAVHSTPLMTRKGQIIGVLSVHFRRPHRTTDRENWFMDLYARMAADFIETAQLHKRLQQELADREQLLLREQTARSSAEYANRMKDEFLATASHELRTPLNAIIGWCHLLRTKEVDPSTLRRAIDTIDRNAKAQAQLIEDILDVSRVITGKLRLNVVKVDLSSIINAAIDSIQLAADSRGIALEVTAEPSVRHVSGDPVRLQQVVWNLLSNAIKFTPPGGRVSVKLGRAGTGIRITVTDTGDGIEPEFLPHIFDRFSQADYSTTRTQGGLGLGLAIVKHLIELHGGTVRAASAGKGRGSTFTIDLPADAKDISPQTQRDGYVERPKAAAETFGRSIEGVRILIVDDNLDSANVLAATLADRKAIVRTSNSAADALERLQSFDCQVLISDLAMPEEDGFSLVSKVRQLKPGAHGPIRTIALTALARVQDRARALSAGFDMFVAKPVEPAELVSAVAHLVEAESAPPSVAAGSTS